MDRSKAASRRWFDRRAGKYEGGATSRWRDPVQRASLAALDLTGDDLLLDVGCGTGAAFRAASAAAKFVVGVDLSSEMIQQATELANAVENVRFVVADSEQLPFGDGVFTAVLCSNSFHHYPILFARCKRWLESWRMEAGSSSAMRARISPPRMSPMSFSAGSSLVTSVSTARPNWGCSCNERDSPA